MGFNVDGGAKVQGGGGKYPGAGLSTSGECILYGASPNLSPEGRLLGKLVVVGENLLGGRKKGDWW